MENSENKNIEVSLPGTGEEDSTIIEVLNPKKTSNGEESNLINNIEKDKHLEHINIESELAESCPIQETVDTANILDIESYLIETVPDLSIKNSGLSGIEINALPEKEIIDNSKLIAEIEPKILQLDSNYSSEKYNFPESKSDNLFKNTSKRITENLIQNEKQEINTDRNIVENNECQFINEKINSGNSNLSETTEKRNFIERGINGLENCTTPLEEEEKRKLLDSLPQLNPQDSNTLAIEAKKEYYQSLREYLNRYKEDKPPIPLQTYRWEDLKRAKEKGGYPWTHLYKRPLGPDEEPEIVLLLRKSQEFNFSRQNTESPKSLKKVRIHDQVLVKETERYINDLSDTEEDTDLVDVEANIKSVQRSPATSESSVNVKKSKLSKLKGIIKRKKSEVKESETPSTTKLSEKITSASIEEDTEIELKKKKSDSLKKYKCCPPFIEKIKNMADNQLKKRNIKKIPLEKDEKIVLQDETKILKLRESPKAERGEIAKYIEKRDSEDIVEIVDLEESPRQKRKVDEANSILIPDEIIQLPSQTEEIKVIPKNNTNESEIEGVRPSKILRKMKQHVYEDIEVPDLNHKINEILEAASVEALKKSLANQDKHIIKDIESNKQIPLDRMGSSEEEIEKSTNAVCHLAPLSSIDSTSSDEQDRRVQLSPVAEESDVCSTEDFLNEKETELKPALKREQSPGLQDKKVTFSHVEDEAESHKEDIEFPEQLKGAPNRWSNLKTSVQEKPQKRSASVGAVPREKKHFTSRTESSGGISLDVRCACQYYESDSLLPERVNPIGSRPESNVGFVADIPDSPHHDFLLMNQNKKQLDEISTKSFPIHRPKEQTDSDRILSKSGGAQRSFGSQFSIYKNQRTDECGSKDLVVGTIANINDPTQIIRPVLSNRGQREISSDRFSSKNFPQSRDPDTISNRSFVRRLSRSPSKQELYVADIIIPTHIATHSRRNSKIELPQFNIIAPTPLIDGKIDFSVVEEFHKNKLELERNKENVSTNKSGFDNLSTNLNQNEPVHAKDDINISNVKDPFLFEIPTMSIQMETIITENIIAPPNAGANIEIIQEISSKTENKSKAVNLISSTQSSYSPSEIDILNRRQPLTNTSIEKSSPTSNYQNTSIAIDACTEQAIALDNKPVIQYPFKEEERSLSPISGTLPPQNRPLSIENIEMINDATLNKKLNPTFIIQSPEIDAPNKNPKRSSNEEKLQQKKLTQLKRQRTSEVQKIQPGIKQKVDELDNNSEKPSKFSFFGSKNKNGGNNNEKIKEKTPPREKSPSRFFGQRRKSKPELVMVSGSDQLMTVGGPHMISKNKTPSPVAPSTTVQETFSLKVDDLDQYNPRPKSAQSGTAITPLSHNQTKVSSININDSQTLDFSEHKSRESSFCPIVIPNFSQQKFFGSRKTILSSSHPDLDSQMEPILREQKKNSQGGLVGSHLITIPVGIPFNFEEQEDYIIGKPESTKDVNESYILDDNRSHSSNQDSLVKRDKTPSEQRVKHSSLLRRKKNFERTQSQDRSNLLKNFESNEDKLSKTVSFDFGYESKSNDFDKLRDPRDEKQSWLEKTYFSRDHEYEPIGQPDASSADVVEKQTLPNLRISQPMEVDAEIEAKNDIKTVEDFQKDIEDAYFQPAVVTEEDLNDLEKASSEVKTEKKSFMANAQDKSRKIQAGIRNQAGLMKTKLRSMKKPATKASGSPTKAKERKNFKTSKFSKMKMPEMPKFKKPDMSRFKAPELKKIEIKRLEFTKFNMPDMPKFKFPEKFTSMKLKRSKSLKEEPDTSIATGESETIPEPPQLNDTPAKKKFEFNFGTYPRALRRKKIKDSVEEIRKVHDQKTLPNAGKEASSELNTIQRGARDKGPVGSKWADKFSDVSYGDSESGRFQRYGSEVESFERESSMERRMKEDLAAQEEAELVMIDTIERKQFAEFDEENRAIHEISKIREDEFKQRRPIVHQDSNLSEESKDFGWNEKDALRNKMLRRAESEGYGHNYASEEGLTGSANTNHETQSTASSSAKKGVIEEIDDDEFFLRKRGISQDNIEFRQYISEAIREGFDNPVNALAQLGSSQGEYPDSMLGLSQEQMNFEYDAQPPTKPKRSKRRVERHLDSQEFNIDEKENYDDNVSLPQSGSDYFASLPSRPLRKARKVFAQDSQSDIQNMPYFDDIEKDFYHKDNNFDNRNLMTSYIDDEVDDINNQRKLHPPKPPKRKKSGRENEETDSYINGFGGRSISNSYLQNDIQPEELLVYRAQQSYNIPLAQPESLNSTPGPTMHRSRSRTNNEDDDRTSRGADSFVSDGLIIEHEHQNYKIEINDNNGYATVKKGPHPPALIRRRKRTNDRFATMPLSMTPPPERPKRNYSTIGPPRPPKRKTSIESNEFKRNNSSPDLTQYEELDSETNVETRVESPKHLQSGDIVNKMKFRPLPPPPRPHREKKKSKRPINFNDKDDRDGGAEKIKFLEVDVSIQTDPLPDDFVCEDFEITDDMKVIEPRISRTLEDVLLDDPEMEKQKWSNDEHLSKGIQRFRESNQRSISEKSRASSQADRSKSSRPQTPNAIVIEKRIPTPVPHTYETALEASLTVQPIDDMDEEIISDFHDGSYEESSGNPPSTVKSTGSHTDEELERLKEFEAEERKLKELEEEQQMLRDNEEELLIMEKIREFRAQEQKEKEELERKTRESDDQHIIEQILELERQEEENKKIIDKILELQRQEEEEKQIMDKIRQLEDECTKSAVVKSNLENEISLSDNEIHEQKLPNNEVLSHVKDSSIIQEEMEILEPELIPPPTPPPRRRSAGPSAQEVQVNQIVLSDPIIPTAPIAPDTHNLPSRLIDLEVERLRVHALQASHIMVNQLHGAQVGADELECKSGNLTVKNIELPSGFIEDIVQRVRATERVHAQAETQTSEQNGFTQYNQDRLIQSTDQVPVRPPLPQQPFPSEYMHTIPPASFYQLRNPMTYDDPEDYQPNFHTSRRRRHHRRRDSSSGDSHRRSRSTKSPETSVVRLGGQFLQACGTSIVHQMNNVASYIRTQKEENNSRSIGTIVAIFILMMLGFLLMSISGKNIHHHHWDFFNPPDNNGRSQT